MPTNPTRANVPTAEQASAAAVAAYNRANGTNISTHIGNSTYNNPYVAPHNGQPGRLPSTTGNNGYGGKGTDGGAAGTPGATGGAAAGGGLAAALGLGPGGMLNLGVPNPICMIDPNFPGCNGNIYGTPNVSWTDVFIRCILVIGGSILALIGASKLFVHGTPSPGQPTREQSKKGQSEESGEQDQNQQETETEEVAEEGA